LGDPGRNKILQEFIKLPGISPNIGNKLYDMGYASLKQLARADANTLYRQGLNRTLAGNIERVMNIWEESNYSIDISEAVARSKGKRKDPIVQPQQTKERAKSRRTEVMTENGVLKQMMVCTTCKRLVVITNGECPYCRDSVGNYIEADFKPAEEDGLKYRRRKLKKKLNDVEKLLDKGEIDNIDVTKARKPYRKGKRAFDLEDLDTCEKMLKKTIALVEVAKLQRKQEMDGKRSRLSGGIKDGDSTKWDLRNKGRYNLYLMWQSGLKAFVLPETYNDRKHNFMKRPMKHYLQVLLALVNISLAGILFILLLIFTLMLLNLLDLHFW